MKMAMPASREAIAKHQDSPSVDVFRLSQLQQLIWHTHAYGTVFGIFIITLVSLISLGIHWTYRKLFSNHRMVGAKKWDLNGTKLNI